MNVRFFFFKHIKDLKPGFLFDQDISEIKKLQKQNFIPVDLLASIVQAGRNEEFGVMTAVDERDTAPSLLMQLAHLSNDVSPDHILLC